MFEAPLDLSRARILVSNDDGIHANGIRVLEKIARSLSDDVWVVAPETEQSGAGHSLTIARPLRIRRIDSRHFAVDGTPTDAVLLAVRQVLKDRPPDIVLSGVNRGGNLGEDVTYSGTVAAAMEATLLGIPAIALSQNVPADGPSKWHTAEAFGPRIVAHAAKVGWAPGVLINVNFPDLEPDEVKGIAIASQGQRKLGSVLAERLDPRGRPYYWIASQREENVTEPGTDVRAINEGLVTVTPLHVNLTHRPSLQTLEAAFADV